MSTDNPTEFDHEIDVLEAQPMSRAARITRVHGRGAGRGIPEVHDIVLEHEDGSVIEARMPTPEGTTVDARIRPLALKFRDFGECPICLTPQPTSREHIPPYSIGGTVLTVTCERCNNEFGSRFETHLQSWYEGSTGRVLISGQGVRGKRHGGEYLFRVTPDGEPVLFHKGKMDPAFLQLLKSGSVEMTFTALDLRAVQLAALKNAYLAACVIMNEVPRTSRANAIREELVAARDRPRDADYELSPLARTIRISRTAADPVPKEIALGLMAHEDSAVSFAISFNRVFAVDWPLDPIVVTDGGNTWRASDPTLA